MLTVGPLEPKERVERGESVAVLAKEVMAIAMRFIFDLLVGGADGLKAFGVSVRWRLFDCVKVGLSDVCVIRVAWHAQREIGIHGQKRSN